MKTFLCVLVGVMLFGSVGYGAHDLTCYEMIEPAGDYVEADSAITPKLGIANLGNQGELNFPVELIVTTDHYPAETVFVDTTIVDYIGPYPDSMEVELPEWTPEGKCDEMYSFVVDYELVGIVGLDTDEDLTNDTIRHNVTCLFSHDVGVINMEWPEPPDRYGEGSKITVTATVENFGFHAEHDVHVRLEIRDADSNDVELWHALKNIKFLDWRGNESGNPHTIDVCFPTYDVLTEHRFSISCCTELERDACPENDCKVRYPPAIVEGAEAFPECFALEISGWTISDGCHVKFAVPHSSLVRVEIFDVNGRWVCSLENDIFEPGYYARTWNGCDAAGRKMAAGIYLIRMEADEFKAVRKVVIIN
ncbi:hypothetical protein CEE36_09765 [candidate division TA06 bacterium B3_TA06]|uniref:FlgD/Vpr Ig-like domain-containing protein n=1 Tax=candidate division TA06 bacterium B3_TA06 TaxID=2012487 RepID=A0A532UZ79_UNCT6|nr:MAG: hypothetical protein CEE36_09765 [candidate division TA06 bacterium B3_TA06]